MDNHDNTTIQDSLEKTVLWLEEIDKNLYRGTHMWNTIGGRAVFGGQVVGQGLVAASKTVPGHVHIHSLHCYFVRQGNRNKPILYHVERTRDGSSFSSRSVKAVQDGNAILTMQVSYHKHEDTPIEHQYTMPDVPPPESLQNTTELLQSFLSGDISDKRRDRIKKLLAQDIPIEMKPVDPTAHYGIKASKKPRRLFWVKAKGKLGDDANLHRCVAAYLSDLYLLRTAIIPFPEFRVSMMASLDHAMWFHSHFKADEWMLYDCESPRSVGARGFILGRLWTRDGTLAVSVAQEGVVRGTLHSKI